MRSPAQYHYSPSSGNQWQYGTKGVVAGPYDDRKISVRFPGNATAIGCYVTTLAYQEPADAVAGGFKMLDRVYFRGESRELANGDKLEHGGTGEVTGAHAKYPGSRVMVRFEGNGMPCSCFVTRLSRTWPPGPSPHDAAAAAAEAEAAKDVAKDAAREEQAKRESDARAKREAEKKARANAEEEGKRREMLEAARRAQEKAARQAEGKARAQAEGWSPPQEKRSPVRSDKSEESPPSWRSELAAENASPKEVDERARRELEEKARRDVEDWFSLPSDSWFRDWVTKAARGSRLARPSRALPRAPTQHRHSQRPFSPARVPRPHARTPRVLA